MPFADPVRSWQTEQNILNRSCPRRIMSRVIGNGNIVASWPLTLPVVSKSSLTTSLCATVSGGSGRADCPSGKKSLAANGLTFGCTAIFCAQPDNNKSNNIAHAAKHACQRLAWDIEHLARLQAVQKLLCFLHIKF